MEKPRIEGIGCVLRDAYGGKLRMCRVQKYVFIADNDSGRDSQNEGVTTFRPPGSDSGQSFRGGIGRPIFRKGRGVDGARGRGVWKFDKDQTEIRRLENGVDADEKFHGSEGRAARSVDDPRAFPIPTRPVCPRARAAKVVCIDGLGDAIDNQRLGHDSVLDAAQFINDEIDA